MKTLLLGREIDPETPLIGAGFDSLSAAELRRAIENDVGVTLPGMVVFDYPTVAAIAGYLSDQISPLAGQQQQPEGVQLLIRLVCGQILLQWVAFHLLWRCDEFYFRHRRSR